MTHNTYRVVVAGRLVDGFVDGFQDFDNITQRHDGADTIIEGNFLDQSHLHALLNRLRGLGIEVTGFAKITSAENR